MVVPSVSIAVSPEITAARRPSFFVSYDPRIARIPKESKYQILEVSGINTMPLMVLWIRSHNYWVLGPSGIVYSLWLCLAHSRNSDRDENHHVYSSQRLYDYLRLVHFWLGGCHSGRCKDSVYCCRSLVRRTGAAQGFHEVSSAATTYYQKMFVLFLQVKHSRTSELLEKSM